MSWAHGLCGCFNDCGTCLCAYCCTPCLFHTNANRVGVPCGCCLWYIPLVNWWCFARVRGKVRERRNISGSFAGDCLVHWCCHCCALAQESQELALPPAGSMAQPVTVTVVQTQQPTAAGNQPYPAAQPQGYNPQGYPPQSYPAYNPEAYPYQPQDKVTIVRQ